MAELITQVDENGGIVGGVDYDFAHKNNVLHAVVFIFLLTYGDDSTVPTGGWFITRSENDDKYPGLTSAVAGHIEYKEHKTLAELGEINAYNELAQEVGVTGVPIEFVGQKIVAVPKEQQLLMVYTARVTEDLQTKPLPSEVKAVKHLSIPEVLQLIEAGKFTPFALEAMRMIGIIPPSNL